MRIADAWVQDWTAWASAYQISLRRRKQYQATINLPFLIKEIETALLQD